jgi:hypothetical protein
VLEEVDVTEKSWPMPEMLTDCGLLVTLSVIVSVPDLVPPVVGSKNTPIWQLAPAARLLPHPLRFPKSEGLVAMFVIASAAVPVFIMVTFCGSPLVPTYCPAKLMVAGEVATTAPGGVVPVRLITWGLPRAVSPMVSDAETPPVIAVGENVALTWQVALDARVDPQVFVWANRPALAPVIAKLEIVKVAVPVFVKVTVCSVLVVPTACPSKTSSDKLGVSAGQAPCNNTLRSRPLTSYATPARSVFPSPLKSAETKE